MADILIYWGKHWMDDLTDEQVEAMNPKKKKYNYDTRYQHCDIAQVKKNGAAAKWKQKKTRRIAVIDMPYEEAKSFAVPTKREKDTQENAQDSLAIEKMIADEVKNRKRQGMLFTKREQNDSRKKLQAEFRSIKPIRFNCRYKIDESKLTKNQIENLKNEGGNIKISRKKFESLIIDKAV